MTSLEELIRSAECLQTSRKGGDSVKVALSYISHLFQDIDANEEVTFKGRLFLAQQGVDSAKVEEQIEKMKPKLHDSSNSTHIVSSNNRPKYRSLTAVEHILQNTQQVEILNWRSKANQVIDFLKEMPQNSRPVNNNHHLFSDDPFEISVLSHGAQAYASHICNHSSFSSAEQIINSSLDALSDISNSLDNYRILKEDFFHALQSVLSCKEFSPNENLSDKMESPSTLVHMIVGSINFLQHQFRHIKFPDYEDQTIPFSALDSYVSKEFPGCPAPWPHIWIAIRSGSYDSFEEVYRLYPSQTNQFKSLYKRYMIENVDPITDIRISLQTDAAPTCLAEQFRLLSYNFLLGQDTPAQTEAMKTAEDSLFCLLSPLQYTLHSNHNDLSQFLDVKRRIIREGAEIFNANSTHQFIQAMFLCLSCSFTEAAQLLLEGHTFPLESLHLCLAMKARGLCDSTALPPVVNEFVSLLPLSFASAAVDYLSFAGDRHYLANYLLSLDYRKVSFNFGSSFCKQTYGQPLIAAEIAENPVSVKSLQLLIICGALDNALTIAKQLSEQAEILTPDENAQCVCLFITLLDKIQDESIAEDDLRQLFFSTHRIVMIALSKANLLSHSLRAELIEDCQRLTKLITILNNNETIQQVQEMMNINDIMQPVRILIKITRILSLIEEARGDEAFELVKEQPHVLPLTEQDIEFSLKWIRNNVPSASSNVWFTTLRLISYLAISQKSIAEYSSLIETLLRFLNLADLDDNSAKELVGLKERMKTIVPSLFV